MIRKNLVLFIQRHKQKLIMILGLIIVLVGFSFIATVMVSTINTLQLSDNSSFCLFGQGLSCRW